MQTSFIYKMAEQTHLLDAALQTLKSMYIRMVWIFDANKD